MTTLGAHLESFKLDSPPFPHARFQLAWRGGGRGWGQCVGFRVQGFRVEELRPFGVPALGVGGVPGTLLSEEVSILF